jgi:ectoine hydroxylase-related dioxygenase (phytanoyl-CoA dioxygenase family)
MTAAAPEKPAKLVEKITPSAEFRCSNEVLTDADALRLRLQSDGYLFLRNFLNGAALLEVRRAILALCKEHGWLDPAAPLMDGVYSGIPFPNYHKDYMPLYIKLIKLDAFNQFARTPELMMLFERILGGRILAHPRTIARISFPRHFDFTTQPHQDYFYIRGTPETYTAWIPAGDCPKIMGGLALLVGSHKLGFLKHKPAIGAGGNGIDTSELGLRWLASDFTAGDVLIFHSHTVHGALDNCSADRLRISLDYRYQRERDEVDPSSLQPHVA